MSQILGTLAVVLVVLVVVGLAGVVLDQRVTRQRRRSHQLPRRLRAVDQNLARDHAAARRAMNQAAGQAWRNQFE